MDVYTCEGGCVKGGLTSCLCVGLDYRWLNY